MSRRIAAFALSLAVLTLCLGGCGKDVQPNAGNADIVLPEPAGHTAGQIIGESFSDRSQDVTLYYASQDTLSLGAVTRNLQLHGNDSILEAALQALMESAALSGAVEAEIIDLEFGSGIASVNLSLGAGVNRSDQDYLLLCSSIANTLLQFEDVDAVNILSGNRSDPICSLPLGAFVHAQDNIAAHYAQIQSESERFSSAGSGSLSRNVLLYFPSRDGKYMLPEVRELIFTGKNYASEIIRALGDGPLVRSCSYSPIPGNMDFLESDPEVLITESGERIMELHFSSMIANYLPFADVEGWQLYAAMTLTLCSFIPEIDAVRIYIDEEMISSCALDGSILLFEDGLMHRDDFTGTIGSSAFLFLPAGERMLTREEIPLARHASASPLALLTELISAQPSGLIEAASVFPEGIAPEDILGISISDRNAIVNLSANFYVRSQSTSVHQERQLIYAIVNTLCELSGIDSVSFVVEGERLTSLSQNIYLGSSLLPDPGLVQAADAEKEPE